MISVEGFQKIGLCSYAVRIYSVIRRTGQIEDGTAMIFFTDHMSDFYAVGRRHQDIQQIDVILLGVESL